MCNVSMCLTQARVPREPTVWSGKERVYLQTIKRQRSRWLAPCLLLACKQSIKKIACVWTTMNHKK